MCCYCSGFRVDEWENQCVVIVVVDGWENQCVVIVVVVEMMDG